MLRSIVFYAEEQFYYINLMQKKPKDLPHFVYILQTKAGIFYTGVTRNIVERIKRHESGRGAKAIRGKGPLRLVYYEEVQNLLAAMKREREIKDMSRIKKQALIIQIKHTSRLKKRR